MRLSSEQLGKHRNQKKSLQLRWAGGVEESDLDIGQARQVNDSMRRPRQGAPLISGIMRYTSHHWLVLGNTAKLSKTLLDLKEVRPYGAMSSSLINQIVFSLFFAPI